MRAQLQGADRRGARLPHPEDGRPQGPAHPSPSRGPGARPHLPVHARLLCRVAHARGVARADLRRRGSGRQAHPRSGRPRPALRRPQKNAHARAPTAPPSTASAPSSRNSPPSSATPAAFPAAPTRTFTILTTPNALQRRAPNSSTQSSRRQKANRQNPAKHCRHCNTARSSKRNFSLAAAAADIEDTSVAFATFLQASSRRARAFSDREHYRAQGPSGRPDPRNVDLVASHQRGVAELEARLDDAQRDLLNPGASETGERASCRALPAD